ncbi:YkyB family protein [Peribacillus sp. NPDC097675]|uniref:YkyB family protein n=1 Tax=Peribacillus sp. NPDC097675 TaxID=3390618 RepID=UPI003D04FA3B
MNQTKGHSEMDEFSINSLAQAVFIVNKHAKTALEPKNLYNLKRLALNKLMQEGKAKKMGLHFSDNPRFAAQQSDVIVECGSYVFHLPPTKEDLKTLPHLGSRAASIRNPKAALSLSKAKQILQAYIGQAGEKQPSPVKNEKRSYGRTQVKQPFHNPFPSSFLGKGSKY